MAPTGLIGMTGLRTAGFICALSIPACGLVPSPPAPPVWSIAGQQGPGDAGALIHTLSGQIQGATAVNAYAVLLDAPPDRALGVAVQVLNGQGDTVLQADRDRGYIITRRSSHWLVVATYYTQYLIVFEPVPPSKTRMIFKLLVWKNVFAEGDLVIPIGTAPILDTSFIGSRAGAFVEAIRRALK